jgi:hypothetical protein
MPYALCVMLLVDFPNQGRSAAGIKLHEHFWEMSEAIEDVLAWVTAYVYEPI